MSEKLYTIKAVNDEHDTCSRCGRTDLKLVAWLQDNRNFDVLPYGTTCAAKLQKITVKEQKAAEKDVIRAQKAAEKAARFEREQRFESECIDIINAHFSHIKNLPKGANHYFEARKSETALAYFAARKEYGL